MPRFAFPSVLEEIAEGLGICVPSPLLIRVVRRISGGEYMCPAFSGGPPRPRHGREMSRFSPMELHRLINLAGVALTFRSFPRQSGLKTQPFVARASFASMIWSQMNPPVA